MDNTHYALWDKIRSYSLDDPTSSLKLSTRISVENNWSPSYTQRVIEEYKKFVFLAMVAGHKVTPSDEVDQVWHLHMIYTEEYWENFCKNILPRQLHHGPTKGGSAEDDKYDNWYTKTKESYEKIFSTKPPEDIWTTNDIRFGRQFVRLNVYDHIIVKKQDFPVFSKIISILFTLFNPKKSIK